MSSVAQPRNESNDHKQAALRRARRESPEALAEGPELYRRHKWESYWRNRCDSVDSMAVARAVSAVDRMRGRA